MRLFRKTIRLLSLFIVVSFIYSLSSSLTSYALKVDENCEKVEIVFARGSGEGSPDDPESVKYITRIEDRLGMPLKNHHYTLGTDTYNGFQYPHIAKALC